MLYGLPTKQTCQSGDSTKKLKPYMYLNFKKSVHCILVVFGQVCLSIQTSFSAFTDKTSNHTSTRKSVKRRENKYVKLNSNLS